MNATGVTTDSSMGSDRLGFIGLGDIGALIAHRLLLAGLKLRVHNRTAAKMAPLVEQGAIACGSTAELASCCDIIFLCLFDGTAIESVVFGPGGICESGRPGSLIVDLSTIGPEKTRNIAARLREGYGIAWVDAPVSGGPFGAAAGTLAVMAGGAEVDVNRARPAMTSFSSQITHMGPTGCGQAAKACNQMINFGNAAAIAEAMNFASRFGLDPRLLPGALAGGFADSALLRHLGPKMAEGTFEGSTAMTMKDMEIVLDLSRLTGSAMPLMGLVAAFFRLLMAQGHVHDGIAGIVRMYAAQPLCNVYSETIERAIALDRAYADRA